MEREREREDERKREMRIKLTYMTRSLIRLLKKTKSTITMIIGSQIGGAARSLWSNVFIWEFASKVNTLMSFISPFIRFIHSIFTDHVLYVQTLS